MENQKLGDLHESKLRTFKRICVFCGSSSGKKDIFSSVALSLGRDLVQFIIRLLSWSLLAPSVDFNLLEIVSFSVCRSSSQLCRCVCTGEQESELGVWRRKRRSYGSSGSDCACGRRSCNRVSNSIAFRLPATD